VVEDDPAVSQAIGAVLEADGYTPIYSRTGEDAAELATRHLPLAVVLDIILPALDGWQILSRLKARPETRAIPVIIVSALVNHELGLALGADAYFCKPVDCSQLLASLTELLRKPQAGKARVLVIDDDKQLHELMAEVLGTAGYQVERADTGAAGLQMASSMPPDIIILDLMMEGLDGFAVADGLHHDPRTRDIPVVVFTAKETSREEQERLRGKIQALVQKVGARPGELVSVVDGLLARHRGGSQETPHAIS